MRHAGVHWPTGGEHPDRETIYRLPGVEGGVLTMLADSARYWYAEARSRCPVVIWRGLPRIGSRPAELGWSPSRVADACLTLWDEQPHGDGVEYFTPLNELQFSDEAGGAWLGFYFTALFLEALRRILRDRLPPNVQLVYPAWCPDQPNGVVDAPLDAWRDWLELAMQWDVIGMHVYNHRDGNPIHAGPRNIIRTHTLLRDLMAGADPEHGREMPVVYTEWNSNESVEMDRLMLESAARVCADDPNVLGYTYYIWETQRAGETQLSVWGNPDRLALFQNPPIVEPIEPEQPVYRLPGFTPAYNDIRDGAIQVADERSMPRRRMLGLCLAESGFGLQSFDRWASIERTARMVPAINAQDWPKVETIFAEIAGTPTNDLSWGPCHQTWYWWSGYPGDRSQNDPHRHNLEEIIEFRAHMIEDHGTALRTAADQIGGSGEDIDILCTYNKPNVAPINNPNRPNYQRALVEADRILAALDPVEPDGPVEPASVRYEDYRDPEPAGTFASMPKGIILHGSRSGKAGNPQESEYLGTARYEQSNTAGLGWHATIADHRVAVHLTPQEWGWHALQASQVYLGVELAQPTVDDPITDAQVDALADWIMTRVLPAWPALPMHFPSHPEADRELGVNQGKSDAFPIGDSRMDDLRARLTARLQPVEPKPSPYAVGPGLLTAMQTRGDIPASDEMFTKQGTRDEWSEAFGQSGRRYIWLPSVGRVFVYDPAA